MATGGKAASSWSCLSFLKDSLLLPTQNPKLFVPVSLLIAIAMFLLQGTNMISIQLFSTDILRRLNELKNLDPASPDFAKAMEAIMKETREFLIIMVVVIIAAAVFGFANQILAFFAASTTYSGERYSLPELISKVIMKWQRLKGPLATFAMVSVLQIAFAALLVLLLQLATRHMGMLYTALLFVLPFIVFLYLNVVFIVAVAVSVADAERRGVGALRQAWRLMTATRAHRGQGCVLVTVVHLVAMVPSPLYFVALGYSKKSLPVGLALLSAYALLTGLVMLFYVAAVMVYYYQATESNKDVVAHDYVKVPTGEATV